jgi:predicted dehydrogenase
MPSFAHDWPTDEHYRVAVVGCGTMGQEYCMAYDTFPDCELVGLVDANAERCGWLAERFGLAPAAVCYTPDDLPAMLREARPDIVCVVTPVMFMKQTVLTCCEHGASVRGIQCEKPIGGCLADADAMVAACAARGIILGGGNAQRAIPALQELSARLRGGVYGALSGASVHGFQGEIVGGGVQAISVLRLLLDDEVSAVKAYRAEMEPDDSARAKAIASGHPEPFDSGLRYSATFTMRDSGMVVPVYPTPVEWGGGVEVWSDSTDSMLRWGWPRPPDIYSQSRGAEIHYSIPAAPQVFSGYDDPSGTRLEVDGAFADYKWKEHYCAHSLTLSLALSSPFVASPQLLPKHR